MPAAIAGLSCPTLPELKHCPSFPNVLCGPLRPCPAVYLFFSFPLMPYLRNCFAACSCARLCSTPCSSLHAQRMHALCPPTHVAAIELPRRTRMSSSWLPPEPNPLALKSICLQNCCLSLFAEPPRDAPLPPRRMPALRPVHKSSIPLSFDCACAVMYPPAVPSPLSSVPAGRGLLSHAACPGPAAPTCTVGAAFAVRPEVPASMTHSHTFPPASPDSVECSLPFSVMCQSDMWRFA